LVNGFSRGDPGGEGGIFDAALFGEDGGAQTAALVGGEDFGFVLRGVAGAAGAVGFDDDADGGA
jgi:hypothetical protein